MNPQYYAQQIAALKKELDNFLDNTAPIQVGELAVGHFRENFRKGGFVDNGLKKWQKAKRQGVAPGAAGHSQGHYHNPGHICRHS